jgi:acyl carrier protein|tara:strand:- start:97 stop:339 length:243 start_codon:yes stop_codon:yes gene_type:complete
MLNIINQLTPIFVDVFDDDDLIIDPSTTAGDVDGWDSLAHIRLIVAIEKVFAMRFSASEISNLENVGEMAELIISKQANS